ncbi:MAG: response regulator transcription factor [Candidatus Thiodiazotropha endolucinida]|uniref:Alkaline phosphatase synthesis transcriptional regulatory protein PhoP n=2 Tax=Candidatus Thiodiazotropha TaxID=1913444 RepID=A0A7Z0VIK2_9GAMM|nr:response regulator transcription factor [Candidatus Thiodiazotropha endolucinida]MBT3040347.1 response regulator transcription factor [Candidatus Thiodiazotropha sp. (ex Codakia orbicularis)]MBV2126217.1 response regulator transcription factor [Candidatus Thiodiazotropha taylori]MBT3055164.1 response regulator transcription factor [Candidatus Thiodiazotropha sp. (ex Codakia orbicularis)]MCG7878207.1 response regulator transcription factor [Candidatus Thiodiazotropha taylori]MCG7880613.1 res
MPRILLIDDDQALATPLKEYFSLYDLELEAVTLPSEGLKRIEHTNPDLVILDIMLPEMDGFEVCRTIRRQSSLPILMLTARGEVMDRVVGLELGADDYLAKPFEPRELVARIQNILKRSRSQPNEEQEIVLGTLKLDLVRQDAFIEGRSLNLTTLEYRLLALLAQHPGRAYSRDEILTAVKGIEADLYTRSVDILVSRLRQKLKPLDYIKTVWGTGYRLVGPDR